MMLALYWGREVYLNEIKLENTGPIDQLHIKIKNDDDTPPPLVLVGANGSGKSLVIAQIVTAMINAQNAAFEEADVEKNYFYKILSGVYIKHDKQYSFAELEFSDSFFERELVLKCSKKDFINQKYDIPSSKIWEEMLDDDSFGTVKNNFRGNQGKIQSALVGPHIFFPPNRFEDPAWLNELSLKNKVDLANLRRYTGHSDRKVIEYAPMKQNQSWLLALMYDNSIFPKIQMAKILLDAIENFILTLLNVDGSGPITWHLGPRSCRTIGIKNEGKILTNNLLSLSSGQTAVLALFLTILRHADWGVLEGPSCDENIGSIESLDQIKGLVVVDEIDLHLHADLQCTMLPHLISLFPGVQFIVSSHSPLFLLGLENKLGKGGVKIVELPSGRQISAEQFSEFESVYKNFADTEKFKADIRNATKPLLYVEGPIDIMYIRKAAEHLNESELLSEFKLLPSGGSSGLNKIWKDNKDLHQPVILLYDCDVKKEPQRVGNAFQRCIPAQESLIKKGIENLLLEKIVREAREENPSFVDSVSSWTRITVGEEFDEPESWSVNHDNKTKFCEWVCKRDKAADFAHFSHVFDILKECLRLSSSTKCAGAGE